MQHPHSIEITLRFKEAFEAVRAREGRGTIKAFCERNGINRDHLTNTLREPDKRALQPYWIACLCRDYRVSADWVLMGEDKSRMPDHKNIRGKDYSE